MPKIARANPHLDEILEDLDRHRAKFRSDDEARSYLSKSSNEWIDEEFTLCMVNTRYFISNYYAYRDEQAGFKGLYPLFDSQEILHDQYRRLEREKGRVRALILKARQMGSTTYNVAEFFHKTMFAEHINSIIVGQDEDAAKYFMGMYESALDYIPWWMRPRIKQRNAGSMINFDEKDENLRQTRPGLKTWVYADNARKPSGVGRSKTFGRAMLSELAFWDNGSQLSKALFPTFNTPDGFYIMESTANGRNDFWHNLWRRAEAGKVDWEPIFIPFYRREKTYSLPIVKTEVFVVTPEETEMRERIIKKDAFVISNETFNWMRNKKEEFVATDGDDMMFSQEYTCLIGETRVPTSKGVVMLGNLKNHSGSFTDGNEITAWESKGKKEVFRATTRMGYSITGTADHIVPTLDGGDIQLADLLGHVVTLVPTEFSKEVQSVIWDGVFGTRSSIKIDESQARFLGYFLGDGCYHANTVSIVCDRKDEDVIKDVRSLMRTFFGNCCENIVGSRQGGVKLRVGSVHFASVMKELGIYKTGKPHRRIVVPEVIFRSPKNIVMEFLRSLFEADGFCAYEGNRVSLFSKWKDFLSDIQILLLGFGITSRFVTMNKTNAAGLIYTGNALELRAAEARLFCERIGFIGDRKSSRQRLVEHQVGRPQARIEFKDEVVSVVPDGEREVFDITVSESHQFSANGILVHNCEAEESFQSSAITAFPRGIINRFSKRTYNPKWTGEIQYDFDRGKPVPILQAVGEKDDIAYPVSEHRFHVFELPQKGDKYCVGVDVSLGNDGGDYSCCQVVKLSRGKERDKQVACWHGYMNPNDLAEIVLAICWWYEEALAAVEVNSMGMVTNSALLRLFDYENVYRFKRLDRLKHAYTDIVGWWTDYKSKRALITKMDKLLRDNSIEIPCRFTMDEYRDFTAEDGAVGEGAHDDFIMALMIACYCGHEGEDSERRNSKPQGELPNANKFKVFDRNNVLMVETTSQNQAEAMSRKIIGSRIERIAGATANLQIGNKKVPVPADYQNTAHSPIHDKDGTASRLHYEEGVPEELITSEMIAQFEEGESDMESDSNSWLYN